jgi:hypothetical protein
LAPRPGLQAIQTTRIHRQNQPHGSVTKHLPRKNTNELIQNLKNTSWLPHFTLASLDIKNLIPNIPVKETREILENMMTHNTVDPKRSTNSTTGTTSSQNKTT